MARYTVVSIDNETIGQGGRAEDRGEFESAEAAIGCAGRWSTQRSSSTSGPRRRARIDGQVQCARAARCR
jgi:hypothetical protein